MPDIQVVVDAAGVEKRIKMPFRPSEKKINFEDVKLKLKQGVSVRVIAAEYNISINNFTKKLIRAGIRTEHSLVRRINIGERKKRHRQSLLDFSILTEINAAPGERHDLNQIHIKMERESKKLYAAMKKTGKPVKQLLAKEKQTIIDVFEVLISVMSRLEQDVLADEEEERIARQRKVTKKDFDLLHKQKMAGQREQNRVTQLELREQWKNRKNLSVYDRREQRKILHQVVQGHLNDGKTLKEIYSMINIPNENIRYCAYKIDPELKGKK